LGDDLDRVISGMEHFKPEHITPGPDWYLVRVIPPDAMTKGGIILPDVAQEEKGLGVVVRMHPAQANDNWLSPGDLVMFRKHGGQAIQLAGCKDYILCQWTAEMDSDILAKIENPGKGA
jgi:co-chaperonin GroES (HSP10)